MAQPTDLQTQMSAVQWTNGQRLITGAFVMGLFSTIFAILSGMGTWTGGVYTPNLTPSTVGAALTSGPLPGNFGLAAPASPATMDLQTVPPSNGAFFAGGGSYLQYCSVGGCYAGPHLFAEEANYMTTRFDASAQETVMAVNLNSVTGLAIPWASGLAIPPSDVVGAIDGNIFGTSAACTLGTTSPSGTTNQTNGTCNLTYVGPNIGNGKEGVSIAVNASANSGNIWTLDSEFNCANNYMGCIGYEQDSSYSGTTERGLGQPLLIGIFQFGANMAHPGTAAHYIGMGSGTPTFGWDYGTLVNGDNVVKNADFADATSAADVFYCLGAPHTHSDACIRDDSNSDTVLKTTGSHRVGVDLSFTAFSSAIALNLSAADFISFNAGSQLLGYNGSIGAVTYGAGTSGTTYGFASFNNGFFGIAGHLFSRGNAPTLSGCSGATLQVGSTDLSGTIIEGSSCSGASLSFAQADTNADPFCEVMPWNGGSTALTAYSANQSGFSYAHPSASGQKFTYHCVGQ